MTTKVFQTAKEAIEYSIDYNTITRCKDTDVNITHLMTECDGHFDLQDFWADDEDEIGMIWRVQLTNKD